MDVARFRQLPLLGILRGIDQEDIAPLADAVAESGLTAIEITMNTRDAPRLIRRMVEVARGRFMVGAGTVLTLEALDEALRAGATFAVLPVLIPDVVAACVAREVPAFPGAFTPLEIHDAWRAGATMVKLFPAGSLGPGYVREIMGPFNDLEVLACGGVTAENLKDYFAAGAAAVAFGASIFRREWLAAKRYDSVTAEIRKLVGAYRAKTG